MIHTFQIVCALESIINHVLSTEHTQKDTIITISFSKNVKHANRGKQKTRRMSVLYSAMSCVICDNDRKGCEEIDISKIGLKYHEIQVLDNYITATLDSLFYDIQQQMISIENQMKIVLCYGI